MKEFISILISFLFMGVADSINAFFNNALSINAIVVCGSLFSIDLILKSLSDIAIYTYRTIRKNESAYLIITGIFSLLLGLMVLFSRGLIINIFDLTINQKEILYNILGIYVLYLMLGRVANALFEMIRLRGELKNYRKSLILYTFNIIRYNCI